MPLLLLLFLLFGARRFVDGIYLGPELRQHIFGRLGEGAVGLQFQILLELFGRAVRGVILPLASTWAFAIMVMPYW